MPTKITASYDNPADPAVFDTRWADGVVELAEKLPGLQRLETSKAWPKEDGSATPAYRMIDMYFLDYYAASAAVRTPEADSLFSVLTDLGAAGAKFIFFDIEPT